VHKLNDALDFKFKPKLGKRSNISYISVQNAEISPTILMHLKMAK
jgi:hypothetical protein